MRKPLYPLWVTVCTSSLKWNGFLFETHWKRSTCSDSVVAQPCEGTGKQSEMVFHSKDNFSVSQSQCHSVNRGNIPAGGEQTLLPYLLLLCFVIPSSAFGQLKGFLDSSYLWYCSGSSSVCHRYWSKPAKPSWQWVWLWQPLDPFLQVTISL